MINDYPGNTLNEVLDEAGLNTARVNFLGNEGVSTAYGGTAQLKSYWKSDRFDRS